ncbi:MAG: extracellular solute-binding protein [Chloroflexi bacterium]|nr:extracellular solute-binding protein [Chloroflexota bacterium]
MKTRLALIALLAVIVLALAACATPTPQVIVQTVQVEKVVEKPVEKIVEKPVEKVVQQTVVVQAATPVPAKKVVSWFQYDQGNVDPKADERAGNQYLREAIPVFNKVYAGKYVWENQYTPWEKLGPKLVAAVQVRAEVPDLIELGGSMVTSFYKNGAVQDLTDWAKAQKWYAEMDASALKNCSGPDGKLYCIPTANRPSQVFVWKDRYPNGFPKTTDEWLKEGERLKKEGKYAMTFFGSTAFDGNGAARAVFQAIGSFGGSYDNGDGKIKVNTPQNVAAVAWLRAMVQNGYVPEIAFAGGFQEEQAFMDSSAGAIPTGLFGYRYINPLTAPSGKKYTKGSQDDMLDAIAAGDVYLAPMPAGPGKQPGCSTGIAALAIPVGAKNADGAKEFINWTLSAEQNPAYVVGPGGGLPVLKSIAALQQFQAPFYKQAVAVASASDCKVIWTSVVNTKAAEKAIMNAVYKLIKTDPKADIAAELQKAEDEYNKTVK